jgi:hypothetical protein
MQRTDARARDPEKDRDYGRQRTQSALESGLRPQTCFLPAEILPFLDEVKTTQGFRRRDEAIAYLVKVAMRRKAGA